MRFLTLASLTLILTEAVTAFPSHGSLAGLSNEHIRRIIPTLDIRQAEPAPGPQKDTSAKLVNDDSHPWMPLRPGDIRGPCPGLNTLASHGWLDRSGVSTPAKIVEAVQNGFNMGYDLTVFLTYAAMLVDGNQLTNLMSIGGKSPATGVDPPPPAILGGLSTHGVFEGDASMTRGDAFFGDNHSFNETLFQEFISFSNRFGGGKFNKTAATELRFQRIKDSMMTNPNFTFVLPRFATAYAEVAFPFRLFVDGRVQDGQLDLTDARGFFEKNQMPAGFFRREGEYGLNELGVDIDDIFAAHPVQPGRNDGVNNFIPELTVSSSENGSCDIYLQFANVTVRSLYPDPQGALREALNVNLENFFKPIAVANCTQVFPFGK